MVEPLKQTTELPKKDLSMEQSKRAEMEGNPQTIAAKKSVQQPPQEQSSPVKTEGTHTPRYKNPTMMIFAIMAQARKVLREGAKTNKENNRTLKKEWERVSQKLSETYRTAKTEHEGYQKWNTRISSTLMIAPPILKGSAPTLSNWTKNITGLLSLTQNIQPSANTISEWVTEGVKIGQSGLEQYTRTGSTITENKVRINDSIYNQGTQAAQSDYQQGTQQQSSDSQSMDTLNETAKRLMEQETQIFLARGA